MNGQMEAKGMDRYLSRLDVFSMALGVMVGWGAFVLPGTTLNSNGYTLVITVVRSFSGTVTFSGDSGTSTLKFTWGRRVFAPRSEISSGDSVTSA